MQHIIEQLDSQGAFFNVREEKIQTASGTLIPGKKALINANTNEAMGIVSSRYKTVSNEEVFTAFVKSLEASDIDTTDAQVNVKFSHGGARTMVDMIFPKYEIQVDQDVSQLRITTLNSYDGAWRYMSKAGAIRMACMNGQVLGSIVAGYSSLHTPSLDIDQGAESIITMIQQFQEAKEYWAQLLQKPTTREMELRVMAKFFGNAPTKMNKEEIEQFEKRPQVVHFTGTLKGYQDLMGRNAYALYNALSDYVTHREYKPETEAHSRMFHTNRMEAVIDSDQVFKIAA